MCYAFDNPKEPLFQPGIQKSSEREICGIVVLNGVLHYLQRPVRDIIARFRLCSQNHIYCVNLLKQFWKCVLTSIWTWITTVKKQFTTDLELLEQKLVVRETKWFMTPELQNFQEILLNYEPYLGEILELNANRQTDLLVLYWQIIPYPAQLFKIFQELVWLSSTLKGRVQW